jgi:D-glycero-alpha-D-manno-heptose-7-phosphate kinase
MLIRAKAPLRIGLGGGGTDVSPYADLHGGAILNACINMFAHATITPMDDNSIIFKALDRDEEEIVESTSNIPLNGHLDILKGVYNRIVRDFNNGQPLSFKLETFVDAPAGSGLGSSSTLVVSIIKAFSEWLNLPLGEYDLAHLAYEIERIDLGLSGGRQDQYAAAFGGVNFMEFFGNDKVIVNPLKIRTESLNELELNLILYYTGTSRLSANIIDVQSTNVKNHKTSSIEAMHELKKQAVMMKESLLKGELHNIGEILDFGWQNKKKMAEGISNSEIDTIYQSALDSGATGGKISGAGGGGFMFFYCPANTRFSVINTLKQFGGEIFNVNFTDIGATSWKIK